MNVPDLEKSINLIYDGAYMNLENIEGLHHFFQKRMPILDQKTILRMNGVKRIELGRHRKD